MNKRFFLWYPFCVLFGTTVMFGMYEFTTEEAVNPEQTEIVATKITLPVKFQESFIFKTDNSDERLILIKGNYAYKLLTIKKNKEPVKIASFTFLKGFQGIENYIPFAHKIPKEKNTDNEQYYFYAVTKQKSTFLQNDVYAVVKITITCKLNNPPAYVQTLYQQENQIMHLCMIQNKEKKYLVSGSYYPSIKIYELQEEKVIHVRTLHNRFLLGSKDKTLIYARINKTQRSKTAFGRWLQSDPNKTYECTICTLDDQAFNKDKERPIDDEEPTIHINHKQYPISVTNGKNTFIFDSQTNQQLYPGKNLDTVVPKIILRKKEITEAERETLKKQGVSAENFLVNNNTWEYFRSLITYKNFIEFAQKNPTKNVHAYIYDLMSHIVDACIKSWDTTLILKNNITAKMALIQRLTDVFIETLIVKKYDNKKSIQNILFTQDTFFNVQEIAKNNWKIDNVNHVLLSLTSQLPFGTAPAIVYDVDYQPNNIKTAYLDNTSITFLTAENYFTSNDIWQGTIFANKKLSMYSIVNLQACNILEKNIQNIFSIGSTIYYFARSKDQDVSDNNLYLFTKNTTDKVVQNILPANDLYPEESISIVQNIINDLQNDLYNLTVLFNSNDTFMLSEKSDLNAFADKNRILDMLRNDYVDNILKRWISPIVDLYINNTSSLKKEALKDTLVKILSEELIDNDIQILSENVHRGLNTKFSIPSESVPVYTDKYGNEVTQKIQERFSGLPLAQLNNEENKKVLSIYYTLEITPLKNYISHQSQSNPSYLTYFRQTINKKIQSLSLPSAEELLHLATRPEST